MNMSLFFSALAFAEFEAFLKVKMKVSNEQFTKFSEGCGKCVRDYVNHLKKELPNSFKMLSDFLNDMEKSDKIRVPHIARPVKGKKMFEGENAIAEAHAYIDTLENFEIILIGIK